MTSIALIHTGIRGDEKLIIKAAKSCKVNLELLDLRKKIFDYDNVGEFKKFNVVLDRCVSNFKGMQAVRFFEEIGIPVINNLSVALVCENKYTTTLRLQKFGVPVVRAMLCFGEEAAKESVKRLGGYPVVIKSVSGSWGRLMAKVADEEGLEAILEHKTMLGSSHQAFYIQEYINKPGRDIRVFVIDDRSICAIYRDSPHWITNTARGGKASNCKIDKNLQKISQKTSQAIGGGILALDVFETHDGYKINEVNHTMEFKNSEKPTRVSISSEIVKYCKKVAI